MSRFANGAWSTSISCADTCGSAMISPATIRWPTCWPPSIRTRPALQAEAIGIRTCDEAVEKDHGRLEIRRHSVCSDIDWLFSDRRYSGEIKFPGLAMIGMVETETKRGAAIEHARRYYLCSKPLDAGAFADVVRSHWASRTDCIGCSTWPSMRRLRSGNGPENMAIFRHIAMNLMRTTKTKSSLKVRRKKTGWNTSYLNDILHGVG